jgi:hypothetical protein
MLKRVKDTARNPATHKEKGPLLHIPSRAQLFSTNLCNNIS